MVFWEFLLTSFGDIGRFLLAGGFGILKVMFFIILPSQIPLLAYLGLRALGNSHLRRKGTLLAGVILLLVFVGFFHAGRVYLEYGTVLFGGSWGMTVALLFLLAVVGAIVDIVVNGLIFDFGSNF